MGTDKFGKGVFMKSEEAFEKIFGCNSEKTLFCPYRVCPLGAHIDHQHGKVTGFAVDKGVHFSYKKTGDGSIALSSLQFDGQKSFNLKNIPPKQCDWADYMRGASKVLAEEKNISCGLTGVFDGDLPAGGISSSAAVIIVFLKALADVNGIVLSNDEMISFSRKAENEYVGVNCGILDQSCEVLCKKDSLLFLDTSDGSFSLIKKPENCADFEIGIFYSGLERSLAGTDYNSRVEECCTASSLLMGETKNTGRYLLRDVPEDVFRKNKNTLPENIRKRAEHYYSESERVEKGVKAFSDGNIAEFGKFINESGMSSVVNYEAGCEELIALYEILRDTEGVYGARFSGAGFKGSCMAVINPDFKEKIKSEVTQKYLNRFPELKTEFSVTFCKTADGVGI